MQSALIFDIKRYAINDGPGIRMTVFLKGCPLQCQWCHNPESISPKTEKMYSADKCIGCKTCVEACPQKACTLTPDGIVTDPDLCKTCGICAEVCPTKATEMSGKLQTVQGIVDIIEKERIFFDQSGGGVTFSGGEPLMYAKFLIELLDACRAIGIHCTVDTSGQTKTETLLEVAKHTDHFLYDLKLMNNERHKKWTGVGNKKILENLNTLAETDASINIRIPLIKNVNGDFENIEQTAEFVAALPGEKRQVNILAYHNIAGRKYQRLGKLFDPGEMAEPTKEAQERIIAKFEAFGLKAMIGG